MSVRLCKEHWAELKSGVSDSGMKDMIFAKSEADAYNFLQEIADADEKYGYQMVVEHGKAPDAMIEAYFRLLHQYTQFAGAMNAMFSTQCPVCRVEKEDADEARKWIGQIIEIELEACRKRGHVPMVQ